MAWISSLLRKNPQFMEQLQNVQRGGFAGIAQRAAAYLQQTQAADASADTAAQGDDEVSLLGGRLRVKKSALLGSGGGWGFARKLRAAVAAQNNNQEGA